MDVGLLHAFLRVKDEDEDGNDADAAASNSKCLRAIIVYNRNLLNVRPAS
jgi:hypothetical protein